MNKFCVIGIYFGKLPNYFSLWLKSCEYNKTVDFLLFTDTDISDTPANVFSYKCSLSDIKKRAQDILKFNISLERAYKLCDFRPLYGLIFKEYIKDYDYWGHCDFDLIFGDLQYFFDKYDIYQYDKFLCLGHLSMYRNTEENNHRFMCDGSQNNYKEVFQNNKSYIFDELPGMAQIYIKNNFSMFEKNIFADIASVYSRYRLIEEYIYDKKHINYKKQIFYFENGKVFRSYYINNKWYKEEFIYIHFKKRPNFSVDFSLQKNSFFITNKGFFVKDNDVTIDDINKYNKYYGRLFELWEKLYFILKGKIRGLKNRILSGK